MELPSSLVREFAKITNDKPKREHQSTVYGTVHVEGEQYYVQIDGSDIYTPVEKAMDAEEGDRVVVMIKDHKAVITGNITSPASARKTTYIKTIDDTLLLYGLDAVGIRSDTQVGDDIYRAESIVDTTDEDNPVFQAQVYKVGDSTSAKIFRVSYENGITYNGKPVITPDNYCATGTATIKKTVSGSTQNDIASAAVTVPSGYQLISVMPIYGPTSQYLSINGLSVTSGNKIQISASNTSTSSLNYTIGVQWIALRIGTSVVEQPEIIDLDP